MGMRDNAISIFEEQKEQPMSIILKGIDLPKDCPLCPLAHYNALKEFTGCEITRWYFDSETMATSTRPSFCPLIQIPTPHGRLIDIDKVKDELRDQVPCCGLDRTYRVSNAFDTMNNAPTILEAEE